jgi:hypothetical protein
MLSFPKKFPSEATHTLPDTGLPGFETHPEVHEDFLDFLTLEDGTDSLSRNVCQELPLYAA